MATPAQQVTVPALGIIYLDTSGAKAVELRNTGTIRVYYYPGKTPDGIDYVAMALVSSWIEPGDSMSFVAEGTRCFGNGFTFASTGGAGQIRALCWF